MTLDLKEFAINIYPDGRMDTTNAARYLACSPKTLAHMRCSGKGPLFVKPGRIFYYHGDLDAWLAGHGRRRSTTVGASAGTGDRRNAFSRKALGF